MLPIASFVITKLTRHGRARLCALGVGEETLQIAALQPGADSAQPRRSPGVDQASGAAACFVAVCAAQLAQQQESGSSEVNAGLLLRPLISQDNRLRVGA